MASLSWSQCDISTSTVLLAVTAAVILVWLWGKSRSAAQKLNIPPFPVRPLPLLGHLFTVLGDLRGKMQELRVKAGDVYSLELAGQLHILIHDLDDIKEIWTKHANLITNMQHSLCDELLGECNKGIIAARDDNLREQRSTSVSILRNFGMGKNIMAERIQDEAAVFIKKVAAHNGKPLDVSVFLNVSFANIICSIIVGKRYDHDDTYFVSLLKNLNIMMKYFVIVSLLTPFKQLCHLPGDLFKVKKWTKASLDVNEMFSKSFINKMKHKLDMNEEPDNFISAYLQEMKKLQDRGVATNLSEENLIAIIRIVFLAGTETTSTTILWCLIYMVYYPQVQEKVYREIEAVIGAERVPNINDKPKLIYLNAFIMESQRKASIGAVGLRREVSSTFKFKGYTIPKGSLLWPVYDSVHFNKKIWGDPDNFRPERFIDEDGALIKREELLPYGIGKRTCLGESLARMELFLFLASIFQRFRIEPEDNSGRLPSMKAILGATAEPLPFKVRFLDRII